MKKKNERLRQEVEEAEKEKKKMDEDIEEVIRGYQAHITTLALEWKDLQCQSQNLKKKAACFKYIKSLSRSRHVRLQTTETVFCQLHFHKLMVNL